MSTNQISMKPTKVAVGGCSKSHLGQVWICRQNGMFPLRLIFQPAVPIPTAALANRPARRIRSACLARDHRAQQTLRRPSPNSSAATNPGPRGRPPHRKASFAVVRPAFCQLPLSRCRFGISCRLVSDDRLRAMDESLYAGDGMEITITHRIYSVT